MARSSLRERRKDSSEDQPQPQPRKTPRLISWHEIPDWMKDNEYILSGYRRQTNSVRACLHSIFAYTHNETVNIHSHLWPALLFVFFLLTFPERLQVEYSSLTNWDFASFALFLTGAVTCLTFSALFHTLAAHSKTVTEWFHALDYAGIIVLTVGTNIPSVYYLFYCDPHLQLFYTTGVSIAGISAAYVVLSPKYSRPAYRGARVAVFSALGLFGVFPTVHGLYMFGYNAVCNERGFSWLIGGGVTYICGALIYANRLPERWWPGRFDRWGASHQIMHVHVVLAALMHYMCIKTGAHHWHGVSQGICPVALA